MPGGPDCLYLSSTHTDWELITKPSQEVAGNGFGGKGKFPGRHWRSSSKKQMLRFGPDLPLLMTPSQLAGPGGNSAASRACPWGLTSLQGSSSLHSAPRHPQLCLSPLSQASRAYPQDAPWGIRQCQAPCNSQVCGWLRGWRFMLA